MKAAGNPWMKFYPSDWRADPALRSCTIAARGLWVEMLCIMHEAAPYGSLLIAGARIDKKRLSTLAGIPEKECTVLLLELEGFGVFSRDDDGTIYSRRMRRDAAKSEEGRKQIEKRWGDRKPNSGPNRSPKQKTDDEPNTQKPEARLDDAGDAREPLVSEHANQLAEQLLVIAGHDRKFWPPGWCGAGMRVQAWISEGWHPDIILAAVQSASAKKRGKPAYSVEYFENAIAEEVARQAAPLPKVEIRQAETLTVTHGKPKNAIIQAADDLVRKLASFDGPARGPDELRGIEGEASARLLSHG